MINSFIYHLVISIFFLVGKTPQDRNIHHLKVSYNLLALMLENLSSVLAKNKGADQPAHPSSLISLFVIRLLESIISKLAASEISIFINSIIQVLARMLDSIYHLTFRLL